MEKEKYRIIKTFDRNAKLHNCCGVDSLRPVVQRVYFEDGYAIASDGYILIKVLLSEICDMEEDEIKRINGKFLHRTCYQLLLKYQFMQIEEDGITAFNDSYAKTKFLFVENDCKYPDYNRIFKDSFKNKDSASHVMSHISFRPEN